MPSQCQRRPPLEVSIAVSSEAGGRASGTNAAGDCASQVSADTIRLAVMLLECSVIGSESAGAFIEERFS